jgi:enamine deaminase RidA (YjgF/YER057c/UK114 family)
MSMTPRDEQEMADLIAFRVESESHEGAVPVQPDGWATPHGYANGAVATGKFLAIAGQVGWNPSSMVFESDDFAAQTRQALHNVVEILLAANARPHDLVRLTWYVLDRNEYNAARKELGAIWRELIGNHYPPMSLVFVSGLLEERARVEIEATAVIPEHPE